MVRHTYAILCHMSVTFLLACTGTAVSGGDWNGDGDGRQVDGDVLPEGSVDGDRAESEQAPDGDLAVSDGDEAEAAPEEDPDTESETDADQDAEGTPEGEAELEADGDMAEGAEPEGEEESDVSFTWTDETTGLTWQNPPAADKMNWQDALDYCQALNLEGFHDWRLPSVSELRSMIRNCDNMMSGGACGVKDECLESSCWSSDCNCGPSEVCYWPEEILGECHNYWTTSTPPDVWEDAWLIDFSDGSIIAVAKVGINYLRCVRGETE